jgi:hypothetical protein
VYMRICVYVYMRMWVYMVYVCMRVWVYAYMCTCMCMYMRVCVYAYMCSYVCVNLRVCVYACRGTYVCVYMRVCVYVCICTFAYMYMRIHVYACNEAWPDWPQISNTLCVYACQYIHSRQYACMQTYTKILYELTCVYAFTLLASSSSANTKRQSTLTETHKYIRSKPTPNKQPYNAHDIVHMTAI